MAISTAMATSFKQEILVGTHNLTNGQDAIKVALYTSSATLGAATTAYSGTNEVANGNGYTTGGNTLTNATPTTSGTSAFADFADTSWTSASFTANGCLLYNSSKSNKALSSHAFGGDQTVASGTLTLVFPAADASNAIIRIA